MPNQVLQIAFIQIFLEITKPKSEIGLSIERLPLALWIQLSLSFLLSHDSILYY